MGPLLDFDFRQVPVPFAMRPGLHRIAPEKVRLTPLHPHSLLAAEKRAVCDAGQSRHVLPGFDPAPALHAISVRSGTGTAVRTAPGDAPELSFEEDLAVLDGLTGTVPWLCVCVPSHWAPEEKLGLDFSALHAPVADNAALISASRQLVALVTAGDCWERQVWTVTPSGRYDQHPKRHARVQWPAADDPDTFARQCWLRAERQTFFPVGHGTRQAVFAIRVMLRPLADAIEAPWQAGRLHDSLASMSPAVLAYKNLAAARERLLRWLEAKALAPF